MPDTGRALFPPLKQKREHRQARYLYTPYVSVAPKAAAVYRNPFGAAGGALFPWALGDYPGIAKGLQAPFGPRASKHTIRDWRRGKRRAPQWAREVLAEELRKRIAELQHALALLSEMEKAPD